MGTTKSDNHEAEESIIKLIGSHISTIDDFSELSIVVGEDIKATEALNRIRAKYERLIEERNKAHEFQAAIVRATDTLHTYYETRDD